MTENLDGGLVIDRFQEDRNGGTYFSKCRIPMSYDAVTTHVPRSIPFASKNVTFLNLPAGLDVSPHGAPERQFVVVLSGEVKVTLSNGDSRTWRSGDVFLATDSGAGKGHRTQTGKEPVKVLFIPIADDVDLDAWTVSGS